MADEDRKLWDALLDLDNDALDPELPDEVLDEMLKADGLDLNVMVKETEALIEKLHREREESKVK